MIFLFEHLGKHGVLGRSQVFGAKEMTRVPTSSKHSIRIELRNHFHEMRVCLFDLLHKISTPTNCSSLRSLSNFLQQSPSSFDLLVRLVRRDNHFIFYEMELLLPTVYLLGASGALCLVLAINRLVFSPLASFPGPRLAAVTRWYEAYFDVLRGGQFMYEIQRLHIIYGPVVRIGPNEIHVNDPDFYDTLYAGPTRRRHKDPWFLSSIAPGMSFAASNYDHHRARRSGLSPFFSKAAVRGWEPVIHDNIRLLCEHFQKAQRTGELLELHTCFVNFAVDTVSQYVFGKDLGFNTLKQPVLEEKWKKGVNGIFELLLLVRHVPWMYFLSRILPLWFSTLFFPIFRYVAAIEKVRMFYIFPTQVAPDLPTERADLLYRTSRHALGKFMSPTVALVPQSLTISYTMRNFHLRSVPWPG